MSDVVIRAEGLGKKYAIGHQSTDRYATFRDALVHQARGMVRSARDMLSGRPLILGDEREEFWALRDVNFEINRGEVVGIIGRNGAGKSTLLKVLSQITEPSEGRVSIDGRLASLLEVGTGFHPELSGRENIFLNGAILGMTRAEIRRKFDEIVAFAGVEKFLDTPVKRYSSGMYVRLAFSVAAHLEPEILVVDEVLAVGDVEFQKKCLGKMQDVASSGRTVLFVSHNMAAVQSLCDQAFVLNAGQMKIDKGRTVDVVQRYLSESDRENGPSTLSGLCVGDENVSVHGLRALQANGHDGFEISQATQIDLDVTVIEENPLLTVGITVADESGNTVFWSYANDWKDIGTLKPGRQTLSTVLPAFVLNAGRYTVSVIASLHFKKWILKPEDKRVSVSLNFELGGHLPPMWIVKRQGVLAPLLNWQSRSAEPGLQKTAETST